MLKRGWSALAGLGLFLSFQVSATKMISILGGIAIPVNEVPTAVSDSFVMDEDSLKVLDILSNDVDENLSSLTVTVHQTVAHGSLNKMEHGEYVYQPTANFNGTDSFTYSITDERQKTSEIVSVNITVNPVNDAPVVADDNITILEDAAATNMTVLQNDSDVEGHGFTLDIMSTGSDTAFAERSLTVSADGISVNYQPPANSHGEDWFTYRVTDAQGAVSDIAKVTITVTPQNDMPMVADLSVTLEEDEPVTITPAGSDIDGDVLSFALHTLPDNGSAEVVNNRIVYQPSGNLYGNDSLSYVANDGTTNSAPAQIDIVVNSANDGPVVLSALNAVTSDEDVPQIINIAEAVSDPDGDPLEILDVYVNVGTIEKYNRTEFLYKPPQHYNNTFPDYETVLANVVVTDGQESVTLQWQFDIQPAIDVPYVSDFHFTPGNDSVTRERLMNISISVTNEDQLGNYHPFILIYDANYNFVRLDLVNDFNPHISGERGQISRYNQWTGNLEDGTYHVKIRIDKAPYYDGIDDYDSDFKSFYFLNSYGPYNNSPPEAVDDDYRGNQFVYSGTDTELDVRSNDYDDDGEVIIDEVGLISATDGAGREIKGRAGRPAVDFALSNDGKTLTVNTDVCFSGDVHAAYTISDKEGETDSANINFSSYIYDTSVADEPQQLQATPESFTWQATGNNNVTLTWAPVFKDALRNPADYHYKILANESIIAQSVTSDDYNAVSEKYEYTVNLTESGEHYFYVAACEPGTLHCGCYGSQASVTALSLNVEDFYASDYTIQSGEEAQLNWTTDNAEDRYQKLDVKRPGTQTWSSLGANLSVNTFSEVSTLIGEHQYRIQSCLGGTVNQCGAWSDTVSIAVIDGVPEVADAPAVSLSDYATNESGRVDSAEVGMSPGQFRVDESGAATYQIPFQLPAGIAGVTPELGVSYSSAAGNGPMGIGWSINGVSAISRCRATFEQDGFDGHIEFDTNDRFCLDGQKLIKVNSGSGTTEYRTEIDAKARIVALGDEHNPTHFIVSREDGSSHYYGTQSVAGAVSDSVIDSASGRLVWLITSTSDNIGAGNASAPNHIFYQYRDFADAANEYEILLDGVSYSGHYVDLQWSSEVPGSTERFDKARQYSFGNLLKTTQLLEQVVVSNYRNENLFLYDFIYETHSGPAHSRVSAVQQCGFDTDNSTPVCLPATQFTWYDDDAGRAFTTHSDGPDFGSDDIVAGFPVDIDANGYPDVLTLSKNGNTYSVWRAINHSGTPGAAEEWFSFTYTEQDDRPAQMLPVDINGDGIPEIFYMKDEGEEAQWYYAPGMDGSDTTNHISVGVSASDSEGKLGFHDVQGDAYPDVLYVDNGAPKVKLNNRSGGFDAAVSIARPTMSCSQLRESAEFAGKLNNICRDDDGAIYDSLVVTSFGFDRPTVDFDGDGRADFIAISFAQFYASTEDGEKITDGSGGYWEKVNFPVTLRQNSAGDFAFEVLTNLSGSRGQVRALPAPDDDFSRVYTGDMNRDGLTDILYFDGHDSTGLNIWYAGGYARQSSYLLLNPRAFEVGSLQIVDINKDTRPDIVYFDTREDSSGWYVVYQQSNGTYFDENGTPVSAEKLQLLGAYTPGDITMLADWTGDGEPGLGHMVQSTNKLTYWWDYTDGAVPSNRLQTITNSFGLTTAIHYKQLTDPSVYTKGSGAEGYTNGRCELTNNVSSSTCSPVFDLINPSFVVSRVASEAAGEIPDATGMTFNAGENHHLLEVSYFYEGLRAQAGGRGLLGFNRVYSTDINRGITTETEYFQDFPLVGMPKQTTQYIGERDAASPVYLSKATNSYDYTLLRSDIDTDGNEVADSDTTVYPWLDKSIETSYALNDAGDASVAVSTVVTDNDYVAFSDNHVNLQTVTVSHYEGEKTEADLASATPVKSVETVNQYGNDDTYVTQGNWWPGRLTHAQVTHTLGSESDVRTSAFDYDATSGLLVKETIAPGGGEELELNTLHCYDDLGIKTDTVTFSQHYNVTQCQDQVTLSDNPFQVYRKQSISYSHDRRYVTKTRNALHDIQVINALDYNKFGQPTKVTDVNNVVTQTWYDVFGRAYASQKSTGERQLTERRFAKDAHRLEAPVINNLTYHFVEKVSSTGPDGVAATDVSAAPETFTYYDVMGRAVAVAKQGFADSQYSVSTSTVDMYGQTVSQTQPHFHNNPVVYKNTTEYDRFGRIQSAVTAAGATTDIVYGDDGLTTTTSVTFAGNGGANQTQTKVEIRNILGETIEVQDKDSSGTVLNSLTYLYHPTGSLHTATVAGSTVTTQFDDYGRKTSMQDPNKGDWSYRYNALGELVMQTKKASSPGNHIVTGFRRDMNGRTVSRTLTQSATPGSEGSFIEQTRYQFDAIKVHRLATECFAVSASNSACDSDKIIKSWQYDSFGRAHRQITQIDGIQVTSATTFDGLGRVFQQFDDYSTFSGIRYRYTTTGYPVSQEEARYDASNHRVVYQRIKATDSYGNAINMLQNGTGSLTDASGGSEQFTIANNFRYVPESGLMRSSETFSSVGSRHLRIQHNEYTFDAIGNLRSRQRNSLADREITQEGSDERYVATHLNINGVVRDVKQQSFHYDALNRMTHINHNDGGFQEWTKYASNGNITWKRDKGWYCYSAGGPHAVSGIVTTESGDCSANVWAYDDQGNLTGDGVRQIAYSEFDKATSVTTAETTITFAYGTNRSRYERTDSKDGETTRTLYFGSQERIYKQEGGNWVLDKTRRNLPGAVQTVYAGTGIAQTYYQHKDHLGSVNTLTNDRGEIVQKLYFDAWGQQVDIPKSAWHWNAWNMAAETLVDFNVITPRGFTGHEHLKDADIIHMNGRIYDPTLGRMLQADPFVQAPKNSQNYNRYSYVLNNPLSFTDPSGYLFKWLAEKAFKLAKPLLVLDGFLSGGILGAISNAWLYDRAMNSNGVAGIVNVALNFIPGCQVWCSAAFTAQRAYHNTGSVSGAFRAGLITAGTAGAFYGIGRAFQGVGFWAQNGAGHIFAHAVAGGIIADLQGGKFGHGFFAAGVTKGFQASGLISNNLVTGTIQSAIVGGTASAISGGKFANGAVTAAFQYLYNAAMSKSSFTTKLTHRYKSGCAAAGESDCVQYQEKINTRSTVERMTAIEAGAKALGVDKDLSVPNFSGKMARRNLFVSIIEAAVTVDRITTIQYQDLEEKWIYEWTTYNSDGEAVSVATEAYWEVNYLQPLVISSTTTHDNWKFFWEEGY